MMISFLSLFIAGHLFIVLKEIFRAKGTITKYIAEGGNLEAFISERGQYTLSKIINDVSGYIIMWIAVGMMAVLIFSAIIWLREWYGNNRTVYTMMTTPINRHYIILSKFCNVFLIGCIYLSTQIICFFIDNAFMKLILGKEVLISQNVMTGIFESVASIVLPGDIILFTMYFLAMVLIVAIIFNGVMLQRSYGIKGIIISVLTIIAIVCAYIIIPNVFMMFVHERMFYISVLSLILIVGNYFSCYWLLKNKVHV